MQLLLIDLLVGETLSVDRWHIQHKHHLDDGFQSVLAMARHEGIDPDAVREELQPTPIDVSKMGGSDLTAFISKYPQRLGELTTIIMSHQRGELVGMLETACSLLGYTWSGQQWVKADDQASDGQMQAEPITAVSNQVDMAQPDNEPMPGTMHQVQHGLIADETTPAAADHVDGEQLAEQMLEAMSATPSREAPEKKASRKATSTKPTGKAKPTAAAAKTPTKPAPKKAAASKASSSKTAEAA